MAFAPTTQLIMVLIEMHPGQEAPLGAAWVRVLAVSGGYELQGSLSDIPGVMSRYGVYQGRFEAGQAGIDHARACGCPLLYVERH